MELGRVRPLIEDSAYQEVEYLETASSGATINLGFKYYNSEEELEVKFYAVSAKNYGTLGSYKGSLKNCIYLYRGSSANNSLVSADDDGYIINTSTGYPQDQINILNIYRNVAKNNGVIVAQDVKIVGTDTTNFYIFSRGGDSVAKAGTRIYYLWTKKNGNITRHFIPCYRKSDNKPGMYNLVTKQFFSAGGTGGIIAGPDANTKVVKPISFGRVKKRVPNAYQEVEYIYAPTSQRGKLFGFTTDMYQTSNTKMETTLLFKNDITDSKMIGPFGSRNDAIAGVCIYPKNTFRTTEFVYDLNQKYNIKIQPDTTFNRTEFYVDNKLVTRFSGIATKTIRLYTYKENDEGIQQNPNYVPIGMCLYETKFWESETLTHDYIPVKKLSNNEYGLYDLVTNSFLSNAGNGVFSGGQAVKVLQPLSLLVSKGSTYTYQKIGDTLFIENAKYIQAGNTLYF